MTNRLALALMALLLGCERADHVEHDEAFVFDSRGPAVGDATWMQQNVTITMQAADSEHVEKHDVSFSLTTTAVDAGAMSASRMVVERDVRTRDGRSLPALSGAYLVHAQNGTMVAAREDGRPLDDNEGHFFTGMLPPVTPAERETLHRRVFHTGDRFAPDLLELRALGLGQRDQKRNVEVHVLHTDAHAMTYDATFEMLAKPPIVGKTTVHGTTTNNDIDQVIDTVWSANDKQLGTSHGDIHGRFTPVATSPRPR